MPGNVVVRADGKCGVACPCPAHALQSTGLRPRLLGHADITAETPIPWPQKLCFRASILSLCTQFTASYSSFGSFSCSGAWGVFDASRSPNCHCAVWLCFLLAPCGLSAAYCCAFFFLPLNAFLILGCWIWGMKKCWWDKYQSGNEQIASVLDLEAKHGLFGGQANLKMLSAVAKVHEKCNKLFPRVLRSQSSSNPKVPGGLSIRRDTCLVLPCRRNIHENVHVFLVLCICKLTPPFSSWSLQWSCIGWAPLQTAKEQRPCWPLSGGWLLCWWHGRWKEATWKPVSSQRLSRKIFS